MAPRQRDIVQKMVDLFERSGIDADDVQHIDWMVLRDNYQGFVKGPDDLPIVVDLVKSDDVKLTFIRPQGPDWPPVQPVTPAKINYRRSRPSVMDADQEELLFNGYFRGVVYPDPQVGYAKLTRGGYLPMHCIPAMDVALQIQDVVEPTHVANTGDTVDFASMSKYVAGPEFTNTTNRALFDAHHFLAAQCSISPWAQIDVLEGNHDVRPGKLIIQNAKEASELRIAGDPTAWPIFTLPHLLALDALGVSYHEGWPGSQVYWSDSFKVTHSDKHGRDQCVKLSELEDVSGVAGHGHRILQASKTHHTRSGGRTVTWASPGTLAWTDGRVPGVRNGRTSDGAGTRRHEDWQNGIIVVEGDNESVHSLELVHIESGSGRFNGQFGCRFRGKDYISREHAQWLPRFPE